MSMSILKNKEENSVQYTFKDENVDYIEMLYIKYTLYKLCYIFNISYIEAMSMLHSNNLKTVLRVVKRNLTNDEREGIFNGKD